MKISELEYKKIDQDEVIKILKEFIVKFENSKSAAEQSDCYNKFNNYLDDVVTMRSLAYIRFTLNTNDEFYSKEHERIDEIMPQIENVLNGMAKALLASPFRKELEQIYPKVMFKNKEMSSKTVSEASIPFMINENGLITEYTKIMSSLTIEFNGEKVPPSVIKKYYSNADRNIRRDAMIAYGNVANTVAKKVDDIFDKMVSVRDEMSKVLGFKNYVELSEMRLTRNCYSRDDIAKFRANIKKHIVPLVAEVKKSLAAKFKWDNQKIYDNEIYTTKEPKPQGSVEEIFANGVKMYEDLSADTGKLINFMLSQDAFDVLAREGKWGGGYCTSLPQFKTPYVFANFNGSSGDIDVLTHEFGHALAFYKSFEIPFEDLREPTMETAEVHSMSMEFFAHKYMELFFKESTNDYKFQHIATSFTFLPYGTIVDYFQEQVYLNPKMTPAERLELWKKLELEFRPYMNSEGLPFFEDGRFWQKQAHIFEVPFYYIDYCLAQVTAFQFLGLMKKDYAKAFNTYMNFLNQAGTMSFTDLLKSAGLKSPFEESTFIDIVKTVKDELNLN